MPKESIQPPRARWAIPCQDATGSPTILRFWATADGGIAGTMPRGGFLLSPDNLRELTAAVTALTDEQRPA